MGFEDACVCGYLKKIVKAKKTSTCIYVRGLFGCTRSEGTACCWVFTILLAIFRHKLLLVVRQPLHACTVRIYNFEIFHVLNFGCCHEPRKYIIIFLKLRYTDLL